METTRLSDKTTAHRALSILSDLVVLATGGEYASNREGGRWEAESDCNRSGNTYDKRSRRYYCDNTGDKCDGAKDGHHNLVTGGLQTAQVD
jgi:hypothetical protein